MSKNTHQKCTYNPTCSSLVLIARCRKNTIPGSCRFVKSMKKCPIKNQNPVLGFL
ncbi:MAG: membrane protein insertion efficiency factor YidD [Leptolyngbyaceae cyanobacterium RM2_2_4]|nr:membrane protein insertion efficiency factor YidD [Leptolyngbyaceae cyanobacterium SM1_4_3]NJO51069.1 membrane protein insertion efficiency factor YidD [Leptolyngbyaceae cyanobacterium RM2_2_4]